MAIKASNQVSLTDVTDAYSVTLTSETFTFMGNSTSGAQVGLSCSTQVIAYCGTQQCSEVNVGTIQCPTGISATITNNSTSLPTITFTTTASITEACEATIPVTVDDVTFNKVFSFAVATSVDDSVLELYLQKTETGELKSMIEGIADTINITSRGGLNLSGDRFSLDSTNTVIDSDGTIISRNSDNSIYCKISAGKIEIFNTNTNTRFRIDQSSLLFWTGDDSTSTRKTVFSLQYSNGSSLLLNDPNGKGGVFLGGGSGASGAGRGSLSVMDANNAVIFGVDTSNAMTNWFNSSGIYAARMRSGTTGGQLDMFNSKGSRSIALNGSNGNIIASNLSVSGSIRTSKIQTTSNSKTDNIQIGDDCFIGDCDTANCIGLKGIQNSSLACIRFGVNGPTFGYDGTYLTSSSRIKIINGGLELYHNSTPYIDFHFKNNNGDFTSRLSESVAGSIYLYASSVGTMGWFHAAGYSIDSSKHVKTNIKDITDEEALKLLDLRTVSFDYKNGQTNKRGMIAEEVMDVYPELVQVPDGYDEDTFEYDEEGVNIVPSLDYAGFVPYLIKMVQIQQREINELKTELSKKSA